MTLRKRNKDGPDGKSDLESLLVFGYQCKIFRDDERAMFVDRGQHLIPWMGDESIMIDRYDGRGHLYDLKQYDADLLDTTGFTMSEKEKALEKACDEERYLELHTDIFDKQLHEEEEMKRLYEAVGEDSAYAAVGFNYDQSNQDNQNPAQAEDEKEDEEPYQVIPELQVPKGVNLPPTVKMHAIIEKTAAFIAGQGTQMEIVIAAKQKNNPQFGFLNFGHELNVYYKHIVRMIQKGKYRAKPPEAYERKRKRKISESADGHPEHGYLHPSLGGKQPTDEEVPQHKFLESVTQKLPQGQIANTAYAKLLSNLSKHTSGRDSPQSPAPNKDTGEEESATQSPKAVNKTSLEPPPAPTFLKTEKSSKNETDVPPSDPVTVPGPNQPPPPGTEPLPTTEEHHHGYPYDHSAHGMPPHYGGPGPYPPGYDYHAGYYGHHHPHHHHPPHHHYDPAAAAHYAAYYGGAHYGAPYGHETGVENAEQEAGSHQNGVKEKEKKKSEEKEVVMGPLPKPEPEPSEKANAVNYSDSSDEDEELATCPEHISIPPRGVRPIIDKMADYVFRNGRDFEVMMRKKNDERFRFLNTWHPHHSYYEWKRERLERVARGETESDAKDSDNAGSLSKSVSFSIRQKEGDAPAVTTRAPAVKRALLGDDSDVSEEDVNTTTSEATQDAESAVLQGVVAQQQVAMDEKKIAEQRVRNKLAVAAREKLATVKEEGKLKAERKKKAAMFAALLAKTPGESNDELSRISSLASIEGGDTQSGTDSPFPPLSQSQPVSDNSRRSTPVPTESAKATPPPSLPESKSRSQKPRSRSNSSRSLSPSVVKKTKSHSTRSRSRSKSRRSKHTSSKSRRRRSRSRAKRSRSRGGSTAKSSRSKQRRSRSRSRNRKKTPPLPSAYSVNRRSSSPTKLVKRRKSRSASPSSRHKRPRKQRSRSRTRKSRSRSGSRRKRRSRSRSNSKSHSRSSKKSKPKKIKKSSHKHSPSRKKGKMVPIPELPTVETQIIVSSDNESQGAGSHTGAQNGDQRSGASSRSSSPGHMSEGEVKSPKPSEDLLSKVRAMLQAHKEILQSSS